MNIWNPKDLRKQAKQNKAHHKNVLKQKSNNLLWEIWRQSSIISATNQHIFLKIKKYVGANKPQFEIFKKIV